MNSAGGEGARSLGYCRGKWGGVRSGNGSDLGYAIPLPTRASPALGTLGTVVQEVEAEAEVEVEAKVTTAEFEGDAE